MTPLGHASVGYIGSSKIKSLPLATMVFGSLFPDIDFALYFLNNFNETHRTFSHSIFTFIFMSTVIYIFSQRKNKLKNSMAFFIGAIVHVLIDSCLDSNPSNGMGVMMFWPVSNRYIYLLAPLSLEMDHGSWDEGISFVKNNIINILLIELPFWIYAVRLYQKSKNG